MPARSIETTDQDLRSEYDSAPTDPAPEAESETTAGDIFYPDELGYLMYDQESEIDPADQDPALLEAFLSGVPTTPIRAAALYIDADNQSSACAEALTGLLRHEIAVDRIDAFIAGNHSGRKIGNWLDAFQQLAPEIQARPLEVPITPDAADVALIMELGANLDHHIRQQTIVVVVSRDGLLIRAAEQAKDRGARVFLAYADGDVPTARNPRLTTLLLPVTNPLAAAIPKPGVKPAAAADPNEQRMLDALCADLEPESGGGYSATAFGTALRKLGLKNATNRRRFIEKTTAIQVRGTGPNKRYFIHQPGCCSTLV